jgi:O-antigen chain-terminating methyltransferase
MHRWTQGLLGCIDYVVSGDPAFADVLNRHYPQLKLTQYDALPLNPLRVRENSQSFGYASYAFGMRDHGLLTAMQQGLTAHFTQCQNVLDVGCGTGVFLECLQRANISAMGVERNAQSARFAKSLALKVAEQDALDFLAEQRGAFDGIYCSHFVEHLPFEGVERLVQLVAQALQPGGKAVFVFPDPESIRSQLLGFWRDPEHVRFYHPDILSVLGRVHGLSSVHNSQNIPGRCVGPFSLAPPPAIESPDAVQTGSRWWSRLLARMGVVHVSELQREKVLRLHLQKNLEQLWAVSQTWAWEDNATLVFRKTSHG